MQCYEHCLESQSQIIKCMLQWDCLITLHCILELLKLKVMELFMFIYCFGWRVHQIAIICMHYFSQSDMFHSCIVEYIWENIWAHVNELDKDTIKNMGCQSQLAYSHPPDPDAKDWKIQYLDCPWQVVCSQQVHACSKATCFQYNKYGQLICKYHAPWEVLDIEVIDTGGRWKVHYTVSSINNFCPLISVMLCCINNIKLITNGVDTKDAMWYSTMYQSKKQCKNHDVSALMM